jgi:hypothetical protein
MNSRAETERTNGLGRKNPKPPADICVAAVLSGEMPTETNSALNVWVPIVSFDAKMSSSFFP